MQTHQQPQPNHPISIGEHDALIVVDVQNDFCPNGALAVQDGHLVIDVINGLMGKFRHVVLTQDWHPADHVSFADNHAKQPFSTITLPYGEQILWPRHCVQGSHGAKLHDALNQTPATLIIRKGHHADIDSYSAFLEADRQTHTGLAGLLQQINVKRVFITGLATDFCVAWTAMDACDFGFECFVIDDACRGIDADGSLAQAWEQMTAKGVRRIDSQDIA